MPMVATSRMTRGACDNRRTTISSMTAPKSVPHPSPSAREGQNGTPYCTARSTRSADAIVPMLPAAKLITFVDR